MMELGVFVQQVKGFSAFTAAEKIVAIGYFLHIHKLRDKFKAADINMCFDALHIQRPANAGSQMNAMTSGKVKRLLGNANGFRLNNSSRENIAAMLPSITTPKEILNQLKELEANLTHPQQKTFLHEANVCFAHEAYRASIIMAWNLAYHHVCTFIFNDHLSAYNARIPIQFKHEKLIVRLADFEDTKESIVIAVAKGAGIISSATAKTLKAKLDIRNTSAHPSSTTVLPITAEEVISDLVQNILLKSPL
jgi:hypothetical protein